MIRSAPEYINTQDSDLSAEFYGTNRGEAKLLRIGHTIESMRLGEIANLYREGDVLVVNNSMMIPSSLDFYSPRTGSFGALNVGTGRYAELFLCEPRFRNSIPHIVEGEEIVLIPDGVKARLHHRDMRFRRYWWSSLKDGYSIDDVLMKSGDYIRYNHTPFQLPPNSYVTIFSKIPGSVEFPSASYHFTPEILQKFRDKGVEVLDLTLHCNLGSLEKQEVSDFTMNEFYSVPLDTIGKIIKAKRNQGRVIALGTTVVKALETLFNIYDREMLEKYARSDSHRSFAGISDLYIHNGKRPAVVSDLITGMHEKESTHLEMLKSFSSMNELEIAYRTAIDNGYSWHEFGDLMLFQLGRSKDMCP